MFNTIRKATFARIKANTATNTLMGASGRICSGWPAKEITLSDALPAYMAVTLYNTDSRNPDKGHNRQLGCDFALDIFGITESVCWDVKDQVQAVLDGTIITSSTNTAAGVRTIIEGAARMDFEETERRCHHLTVEYRFSNIF